VAPPANGIYDANTAFGSSPAKDADWSLGTLLRILEEHGVERALTISLRGKYYDFITGNDETLESCRNHPVLLPAATVDPRQYLDCSEEVRRCVDQGFLAFRFFPDSQGWPLEWLPFFEICELLAEHGLPIILPAMPAGTITQAGRHLAPYGMRVLFLGAGYGIMAEVIAAIKQYPRFYFDTHLLDTPGAFEVLCRAGGSDRLVFGSGTPERYFESAANMLNTSDLTPEQRRRISQDNLREFLGQRRTTWV
jgi:predicted TIM-barrel fold metal-dependent hydrolase